MCVSVSMFLLFFRVETRFYMPWHVFLGEENQFHSLDFHRKKNIWAVGIVFGVDRWNANMHKSFKITEDNKKTNTKVRAGKE